MIRTRAERDELALSIEDMVSRLARKVARVTRQLDYDDLLQDARIGALKAAVSWDPERGAFETHAYGRVRGEILDGLRQRDVVSRRSNWDPNDPRLRAQSSLSYPVGDDATPLGDLLADVRASSPEELAVDAAYLDWQILELQFAMGMLSGRQRDVIHSYFWGGLKLWEIAEEMGLSESRISQIRTRALHVMRFCMWNRDELL